MTADVPPEAVPAPATEQPEGRDVDVDADRLGVPSLVPVLGVFQELVVRALALGWFAAAVGFWLWWVGPQRGAWSIGRVLATVALGWVFLLGGYFLFFACRMTRPNPLVPLPRLRVAMVVTKAPSEPWSMVQKTLRAMLDQDFPYRYDIWVADERPSTETRRWCARYQIKVSTRFGDDRYHQATWPRRTRCKEGNLAYFYDNYGYDNYDVVAQFDADHVPTPGYLQAVVRPFADPDIGYVAAPSIDDSNKAAGWTVRGRLYREASLHGPMQAGSNGGWGPVCIGSHYAVRTAALREVGGLGPELAEDYATTLWLQSAGWDGVFAIDAEAHGEGPETVQDLVTQELQWSRSLGTILVRWAPRRFLSVPWRARIRLTFALLFYPLQGAFCIAGAALPTVAVLTRTSWANSRLTAFYGHLWLCSVFLLAAMAYLRRQGILRPKAMKLWAYEPVLFQLIRWPWTVWGFAQGMWAGRRATPAAFKVTAKGQRGAQRLNVRLLLPPLTLGLLPAAAVVVTPHPGPVIGLYLVCVGQAALYLGCAITVAALHVKSNRRRAVLATT